MLLLSGCMAERLKSRLLEEDCLVDVVCGPDTYRDLPRLLAVTNAGLTAGISYLQLLTLTTTGTKTISVNESGIIVWCTQ